MHNLHFVRTIAINPEEAIEQVEMHTEGWGNENNWRTVFGCVNKKGKITIVDEEAGWKGLTYKHMKKMLEKAYSTPYPMEQEAFDRVLKGKLPEDFEWYAIEKYAKWQVKRFCTDLEKSSSKFDIWKHEFGEWELDTVGLTDLNIDGDGKDYIAFVDMHS